MVARLLLSRPGATRVDLGSFSIFRANRAGCAASAYGERRELNAPNGLFSQHGRGGIIGPPIC